MEKNVLSELGCEHMETVYDYLEGACGPGQHRTETQVSASIVNIANNLWRLGFRSETPTNRARG
jgi:hypothetical protein